MTKAASAAAEGGAADAAGADGADAAATTGSVAPDSVSCSPDEADGDTAGGLENNDPTLRVPIGSAAMAALSTGTERRAARLAGR